MGSSGPLGHWRNKSQADSLDSKSSSHWRNKSQADTLGTKDLLMLDSINEGTDKTEYTSTRRSPPSRGTSKWPFHHRNTSAVPSTPRSSFLMFRQNVFQPGSFFRPHDAHTDDTATIDTSLVPDYVVNYIRGETPETLARKKEQRGWGKQDVNITSRRDTLTSHLVEFGAYFSSSTTDLTRGLNSNSSSRRGLRSYLTGWRGGVFVNTVLALLILVVSIICLIIVATKTESLSGDLAVYTGACAGAESLNIGLHVVVNVLAVVLLAGANYVFQVYSSPTRRELTAAHGKHRWLDLGIPSLRNLAHISVFRRTVCALILLTAITTQIIYNAIIFTTRNVSTSPDGAFSASSGTSCSVNISGTLLGVAALLNLVTVATMAVVVARASSFTPLATLGDAVRSFLQDPDPSTTNACLLDQRDVQRGRWGLGEAKRFAPVSHRWYQAPSVTRRVLTTASWLAVLAPAAAALGLMVSRISSTPGDDHHDPLTRFGSVSPHTSFRFPTSTPTPDPNNQALDTARLSLIAALPQLLLSILYLSINALLTTFHLSHEFSLFAAALGPRLLRVSARPEGYQTTSLFLTLPRPVSWFLLAVFAALGFVLSQAVSPLVLVSSNTSFSASASASASSAAMITFNTTALVILLALLVFPLLLPVLLLGARRTPLPGTPLALRGGSCSAVVSARSHPPHPSLSPGNHDLWLRPVCWGVVFEGGEGEGGAVAAAGEREEGEENREQQQQQQQQQLVGKCGFTANPEVGGLQVGRSYA
ncbi:hypothetical protein F4778DRAFT_601302 [Xylariomycetidae sp. FL2044]|nr:hypothetical protein F4778DRAFT_601302 [Xylariomycetidae sp. FL2044]